MSAPTGTTGQPSVDAGAAQRLRRQELRNAGLPVSLTENLDAMEAVQHIPIEDREAFKYALGATLIKNHAHWRSVRDGVRGVLQRCADRSTSSPTATRPIIDELWREMQEAQSGRSGRVAQGGGNMDNLTPEEIAQMLMQALLDGDQGDDAGDGASQSVQRFAGMEPGRPVGGTYYLYRTLRNLDLDGMLERLMDADPRSRPSAAS